MITEIQAAIKTALEGVTAAKTVGIWQGDIGDINALPKICPALYVLYQGADYGPRELVGPQARATHNMDFQIILIHTNYRAREDAAADCYAIIETIRGILTAKGLTPYGHLWPIREELITAEAGTIVYGLVYRIETYYTVTNS